MYPDVILRVTWNAIEVGVRGDESRVWKRRICFPLSEKTLGMGTVKNVEIEIQYTRYARKITDHFEFCRKSQKKHKFRLAKFKSETFFQH